MLKSLVICTLMCGLALSAEPTLERANISVMKLLHSRNLFMVKSEDHIFSLTWKNATHLEVFSTKQTEAIQNTMNQNNTEEICSFDAFDGKSPFNATDSTKMLNAVILGDNRTVAALGLRFSLSKENDFSNRYDHYYLFLFDLKNCNLKVIDYAFVNKVPVTFYYEYRPQLIAYDDSFDVFLFGKEQCSPCRYNSKGKEIKLEHKLQMDAEGDFLSFHVRLLDPVDTERNYFYVYNFRNGTAVMKLLDENFEVVKQRYVNYVVRFVSVNKDVGAPIGICHFPERGQSVMYCERLDFYLNPVLKPFTITVPLGHDILNSTVMLDALGNTFVGVLHGSGDWRAPKKQLAVFRYDLHGQLAQALDLGFLDDGTMDSTPDRVVVLDSSIVEGMHGQYCIVAYEVLGLFGVRQNKDHHNTYIKCFQAPKDDKILQ